VYGMKQCCQAESAVPGKAVRVVQPFQFTKRKMNMRAQRRTLFPASSFPAMLGARGVPPLTRRGRQRVCCSGGR